MPRSRCTRRGPTAALGLGKLLLKQRKRHKKATVARFERALFAMVANRALAPTSKRACWDQWLGDEVVLPSTDDLALHDFYLGMDYLEEHKPALEKAVYFATADLMKADVDLLFYDTTSLHFEVPCRSVAMHIIAGGSGSSPAPVSRYIPASSS